MSINKEKMLLMINRLFISFYLKLVERSNGYGSFELILNEI